MSTRTAIYRDFIDHSLAWTTASLGSDPKALLAYRVSPSQLAAIDTFMASVDGQPAQTIEAAQIRQADFCNGLKAEAIATWPAHWRYTMKSCARVRS